MSRPDHREPLFLYGEVGQAVTGGDLVDLLLCGDLRLFSMLVIVYDSQLEAAGNRCL